MIVDIQGMNTEEKLMTMELLWDDLCKKQINVQMPGWHENILADRERALVEGKDTFVDWDEAKKEIMNSIS
jgi:hypothetical protein